MELLIIKNTTIQNTIVKLIENPKYSKRDVKWWIGGSDLGSEGIFYWINGHNFDYHNFGEVDGEIQPDNFAGIEHCTEMLPNGIWNDFICEWPSSFICE